MISKISLKNFKCFEDMALECRELNLFTGLNGMGKSTLIQAILLFRQTYEKYNSLNGQKLVLNGQYVSLGTLTDIFYWYRDEEIIETIIEEENQKWKCNFDPKKKELFTEGQADAYESALTGRGFEYISAERIGPRRYYDNLENEISYGQQIGVKGERAVACLYEKGSDLKVYSNMKHNSEASERLDMQINAWMSEITPGIKVNAIPYLDVNLMGLRYSTNSVMGEESAHSAKLIQCMIG